MSKLNESWRRTRELLQEARAAVNGYPLAEVDDYLAHNELELAADCLLDFGDSLAEVPSGYWSSLSQGYAEMSLSPKATFCRYRENEAKFGYIEVQLNLYEVTSAGQRRLRPILTDYRPDWDLGNRSESGQNLINGAPVTIEGAPSLPPGGTGVARLHPLWPEAWTGVRPGMKLNMHEGPHVVGVATVTDVALKSPTSATGR